MSLPPGPSEEIRLDIGHATFALIPQLLADYGNIVQVRSAERRNPSYVINDPQYIKQVLVINHANYRKGVGFERAQMLLGNGIIVSDGSQWRRQRTMMQPGFSRANIAKLAPLVRRCNQELLERWSAAAASGEPVELTTDTSEYALNVILSVIFSEDLANLVGPPGESPFAFLAEDPTRDLRMAMRFRELKPLITDCIIERRASRHRPLDFLSLMLEARDKKSGQPMSDAELLDEITTLIIAGHETSAGTLNWAWYLLSRNPDADARVAAEARKGLSDSGTQFDEVMKLDYTAQVLRETFRLYPPVWLFTRRAIDADELGEYFVAPNTHIFISPHAMHRRADIWPQPERFDPERFDPSRSARLDRNAFIPFSAGPRRCIGEYFSFLEMQMHLGLVARRLELRYLDERAIELDPGVNLRTRHALRVTVHERA